MLCVQPYEYYLLPFCQPDVMETVAENLGEVLRGDKIMNSNYELKMGVEETCKVLCKKDLTASEAKEFSQRIEEDYRVLLRQIVASVDKGEPAPTMDYRPVTEAYAKGAPLD